MQVAGFTMRDTLGNRGMNLSDYYPLMIVVAVTVGAIFALRIFFTLWAPIDRRLNGDQFVAINRFPVTQLKGQRVSIQFKSARRMENVAVLGIPPVNQTAPFPFRLMLALEFTDGRKAYVRMEEIEHIEEYRAPANPADPTS
jgi:hypothetical protein